MTVTPASFRAAIRAFASPTTYLDADIAYWIAFAGLMLRPDVYGSMLDIATEQFVAHNLILEQQSQIAGANGNAPPVGPSGPLASRAVGPVSKSYDAGAGVDVSDGQYALTVYGRRFINIAKVRAVARGALQVGPGAAGGLGFGANGAWAGPPSGYLPGY